MKQKFEAEHQYQKFNTREAFEAWLNRTTDKVVNFVDNGQDLLSVWIDEGGEILHCNLQSTIWNGRIINLNELKLHSNLPLIDAENSKTVLYSFEVQSIENVGVKLN